MVMKQRLTYGLSRWVSGTYGYAGLYISKRKRESLAWAKKHNWGLDRTHLHMSGGLGVWPRKDKWPNILHWLKAVAVAQRDQLTSLTSAQIAEAEAIAHEKGEANPFSIPSEIVAKRDDFLMVRSVLVAVFVGIAIGKILL